MIHRTRSPRSAALLTLAVGIALIILYLLLKALQVGGIGQPTDIGGGGIVLIGYAITVVGLVWSVTDMVRGRPSSR